MESTSRKKCSGCNNDIEPKQQYVSSEENFYHAKCVRCSVCGCHVKLESMVATNEGRLAHRECLARPCSICGLAIIPDDLAFDFESSGIAHSGCLICAICNVAIDRHPASALSDGRIFHAKCLVCNICKTPLESNKLRQHPYWKRDFFCELCGRTCPSCFCCERKHSLSKMSLYPGGFYLCRRCSCMGLVENPVGGGEALLQVLKFFNRQLGLQFTTEMLKNQNRTLEEKTAMHRADEEKAVGSRASSPRHKGRTTRTRDTARKGISDGLAEAFLIESPKPRPKRLDAAVGIYQFDIAKGKGSTKGRRLIPPPDTRQRGRSETPPMQKEKAAAFLETPTPKNTANRTQSAERYKAKAAADQKFPYDATMHAIPVCLVTFEELNKKEESFRSTTKTFDTGALTRSVTLKTAPVLQRDSLTSEDKAELSHLYGRCDCRTTEVVTVESRKRKLPNGEYEWIEEGRSVELVRQVKGIYLLSGLPECVHSSHMAHELTHAWMFLSGFPPLDPAWEEGICNFVSAQYLEYLAAELKEKQRKSPLPLTKAKEELVLLQLWKMKRSKDLIYGEGYRMVCKAVKEAGLKNVLQNLRHE